MRDCRWQPVDVAAFLGRQPHLMSAMGAVASLELEDAWIGAGAIRNAIWDHLHGFAGDPVAGGDVDVVYFEPGCRSPERELAFEARLRAAMPDVPWSVHNQARMHLRNGDPAYRSTEDAMRCWPETATAIAARRRGDRVDVIAPHGIADLVGLVVRPTPAFARKLPIYRRRIASKDWARRWPRLTFVEP